MRRIAIINQKGGVGKTTTTVTLGAALAERGRRVVVVDMDAQANLSLSLGVEAPSGSPTSHTILIGETSFARALQPTALANLSLVPSNLDLSGAELELASAIGREYLLRDALRQWQEDAQKSTGESPADYVLFDCPPSLGLLSINALAAAGEVLITIQTEFLALQGMSKLVDIVQLLRRRLNPELVITGILPCLYDSRLKLAREVLGEIRRYFPGQVLRQPIRANVKLAEAPSFGQTIFQYAPDSNGADDYRAAANEVIAQETRDPELAARAQAQASAPIASSKSKADAAHASSTTSDASASTEKAAHTTKASVKAKATPAVSTPAALPAPVVPGATTPKRAATRASHASTTSNASASTATKATRDSQPASTPTPPIARVVEADASSTKPAVKNARAKSAPKNVDAPTATRVEASHVSTHNGADKHVTATSASGVARRAPRSQPVAASPKPSSAAQRRATSKKKSAVDDVKPAAIEEKIVEIRAAAKPTTKRDDAGASAHAKHGVRTIEQPAAASPEAAPTSARVRARITEIRAAASRRVLRAEDLPALPPDAFEILSSSGPER